MKKLSRISTKALEAQLVACADMRTFYEKDIAMPSPRCAFCATGRKLKIKKNTCSYCPWTWFKVFKQGCIPCMYYLHRDLKTDTYDIKCRNSSAISIARAARAKEITVWMELISEELALRNRSIE